MPKGEIVLGTPEHAKELACNLRPADAAEIWAAAARRNAYDCIKSSVQLGGQPYTGLIDGKVACMMGVHRHTITSNKGVPWLLTTHLVDQHPRLFLRYCKIGMEEIKTGWGFDHLENFVDVRHHEAIRWLKWLGFTIHPEAPYGVFGMPFHRFDMRID